MASERRYQDDLERQRIEQGEQFLKQLSAMFQQTRQDLAAQFMPRPEAEARMDHLDQVVERVSIGIEKLTSNITHFQQDVPRIYAERADTKQDIAELRTEIEKLKTAREADMQRGFGWRYEDAQGRWAGDMSNERGWRRNAQNASTQALTWVIGGGFILFTAAVTIILAVTR